MIQDYKSKQAKNLPEDQLQFAAVNHVISSLWKVVSKEEKENYNRMKCAEGREKEKEIRMLKKRVKRDVIT